jgi:hypothetical protein
VKLLERAVSIDLPTFRDGERGNLTVVQFDQQIPFSARRLFYMHGIGNHTQRGGHAHRTTEQVVIAVAGRFCLHVTDGRETKTFAMQDATHGVYIPAMIWAHLDGFSRGAVCLVLASTPYDPADYIRDWDQYTAAMREDT